MFGSLKGMTSIAWTTADPVALAKALTAYAKTNPAFTFKAGFVEGRAVEVKSIQDLASMPSKEELIAKVMFLINSAAQRLAVSLTRRGPQSGSGPRPGGQGRQVQRRLEIFRRGGGSSRPSRAGNREALARDNRFSIEGSSRRTWRM